MEDRKRPAGQSVEDLAPPTKRQAVNGSAKVSADADMPWKEDLERYQKDAIYRQMLEYKREKASLESELKDVRKRAVDHDDHLRIVDAWWQQLLEEVDILAKNIAPQSFEVNVPFPTAVQFKDSSELTKHLAKKAKLIKEKVSEIFVNITEHGPPPPTDLQELRSSLTKLLASQKEYMVKFDRILEENKELVEQKESLMLRVVRAEKKLDRAKSAAVAKLEQQAIAGTGNSAGSGIGGVENGYDTRSEAANGTKEDESKIEAAQLAYKEASALAEKQKEQLEALLSENKTLTEQLTAANTRLTSLTEDDYARTELFRTFRAQHEEVIKRINHLEATNIQLREEAEKLQAERTAYRIQVQDEADSATAEIESQLQRLDADLTRVRSTRDELLADQAMRKASQDQERASLDQMRELVGAKDDRISSLESEVQRLKAQLEENACAPTLKPEIDELGLEELQKKYIILEESFTSVNNELPAMEKAYKRSMAMASKKVMDFSALEDKVALLIAEKSKADQKYFAARKDMDTRIGEVRSLRAQNSKSSEIISQLKEVEASSRSLLTNLEKQVSDLRQANNLAITDKKRLEVSSSEALSKAETAKNQVAELTNLLKAKDSAITNLKQRSYSLESDLEQLRTRFESVQSEKDSWKAKSLSNQSGEEEMLRALALCTICRKDFKNTALKTCGHMFCNQCVESRIANRMRKCPNCAKAFDKMDVMTVHM